MKTVYVTKPFPLPRVSFNWLWLAIASVLRKLNAGYNDHDIRLHMGELARDEARAEILGDIANYEKHMREAMAWSEV